ncbi:MAG: hypothetical protein ACI3YD_03645 [Alloprevotella sp.]
MEANVDKTHEFHTGTIKKSFFFRGKIVQGERKEKEMTQLFHFSWLSRSLFYLKIVQGERKEKEMTQLFHFSWLSRSLFYLKIVQVRAKGQACLSFQCTVASN